MGWTSFKRQPWTEIKQINLSSITFGETRIDSTDNPMDSKYFISYFKGIVFYRNQNRGESNHQWHQLSTHTSAGGTKAPDTSDRNFTQTQLAFCYKTQKKQ